MQSARKQAEARVISAARDWVAGRGPLPMSTLVDAVIALDSLDLTPIDNGAEGAAGQNSPETSKAAAKSVVKLQGEVKRAIVDELTSVHHTAAKGLTCEEAELRIRRPHTTTSSAMNWLMNHGWVTDSGYRRKNRSKRLAIVWALTDQALDKITNQGAT